jgi:hypothetical protein
MQLTKQERAVLEWLGEDNNAPTDDILRELGPTLGFECRSEMSDLLVAMLASGLLTYNDEWFDNVIWFASEEALETLLAQTTSERDGF